jgi:hypothetical protein
VQLKLAFEEYNGKTRLKVQYLNPFGSTGTGGITKADGAAKTAIRNRLGSKLRALAGPAQKPAPPAAPPNLPSAKPKAPPATASTTVPEQKPFAEPQECDMQTAWNAFRTSYEAMRPKGTSEDCEQQWFTSLNRLFPNRQPDQLSPIEWGTMAAEAPSMIAPF